MANVELKMAAAAPPILRFNAHAIERSGMRNHCVLERVGHDGIDVQTARRVRINDDDHRHSSFEDAEVRVEPDGVAGTIQNAVLADVAELVLHGAIGAEAVRADLLAMWG